MPEINLDKDNDFEDEGRPVESLTEDVTEVNTPRKGRISSFFKLKFNLKAQDTFNSLPEDESAELDLYCQLTEKDEKRKVEKLPFLIFHPRTAWRLLWDFMIFVILIYTFCAVPIRFAFADSTPNCEAGFLQQGFMFFFDCIIDLIFIIDVFLNFRTAFVIPASNRRGTTKDQLVGDWKKIARNYMTGFFIVDITCSIPMDFILYMTCDRTSTSYGGYRGPQAIKFIRILRVLRLSKQTRLKEIQLWVRDKLRIHPGWLRLIFFMLGVLLIAHWNACIFFFLGKQAVSLDLDRNPHVQNTSFCEIAQHVSFLTDQTFAAVIGVSNIPVCVYDMVWYEQYLVAFYWSTCTMTTVGFGDVTPGNVYEMSFTVIVLLEAGLAFSYMIGNMSNLLDRINPRKGAYRNIMTELEDFIHREKLTPTLAERLRSYWTYKYNHPMSSLPQFAKENLSKSLLRDITAHIYRRILQRLPLFKRLDDSVITDLALALNPLQFAPLTFVYREDDVGDSMYFVSSGQVEMSIFLLSLQKKKEISLRVVADTSYKTLNERPENNGDIVFTWKGHHKFMKSNRYQPMLFKWTIDEERVVSYFGENVLTGSSARRLSTAQTKTWCQLFELKREALKTVASKHRGMMEVYQTMKRSRHSRLLRALRMILLCNRAKWISGVKLFVTVDRAVNLPRMDGILGSCDAYCCIRMGTPEPQSKEFQTLVQHNKMNPVWNETFAFVIDFAQEFSTQGFPVRLYFSLKDYDVFGENDDIGFFAIDVSSLLRRCLHLNAVQTESRWVGLKKEVGDGQMKNVVGQNFKRAKMKIELKIVPAKNLGAASSMPQSVLSDECSNTIVEEVEGASSENLEVLEAPALPLSVPLSPVPPYSEDAKFGSNDLLRTGSDFSTVSAEFDRELGKNDLSDQSALHEEKDFMESDDKLIMLAGISEMNQRSLLPFPHEDYAPDQALPLAEADEADTGADVAVQQEEAHAGEQTINVSSAQRKLMNRLAATIARERQQHQTEISALEMQIKKLKKELRDVVEQYQKSVNMA